MTIRCTSQYERPGGREQGDRVVECHLSAGHSGRHAEVGTGISWSDAVAHVQAAVRERDRRREIERAREAGEAFRLGFDIARLLADPTFRQRLTDAGHTGQPIVPVTPDSSIREVLERTYPEDPRVLLAIAQEGQPHGLRLVWWQATSKGRSA